LAQGKNIRQHISTVAFDKEERHERQKGAQATDHLASFY
jgi:hypothetical protein